MDTAWHRLLQRPRLYLRACRLLGCPLGEVVDHDPDGGADPTQQRMRYQATLGAYRALFGPPPAPAWPLPSADAGPGPGPPQPTAVDPDAQISVTVVNAEGAEVYFKMKRQTPLGKLMDVYCKKQGINRTSVRFHFVGRGLLSDKTAEYYKIQDDDVIDAMVEQTGC